MKCDACGANYTDVETIQLPAILDTPSRRNVMCKCGHITQINKPPRIPVSIEEINNVLQNLLSIAHRHEGMSGKILEELQKISSILESK